MSHRSRVRAVLFDAHLASNEATIRFWGAALAFPDGAIEWD